ncbi:MAG TPA: hypothetical protein VK747_17165, partial [Blastocatellia bacterium]|nr:hypothetical protein [Blastocatellia bacterium]
MPEPLNSYDPQSPARSPNSESQASLPALSAVSTEAREVTTAANHQSEKRALAVLLDLSGDKRASAEWVARELPRSQIQSINKTDLKWGSKREALALVRDLRPDVFAVFTPDLRTQSARSAMALFGAMAGARLTVFGDSSGRVIRRSRVSALAIDAPRLALELLFGYLVTVPLSWLLTEMLSLALRFRETVRASRSRRATDNQSPLAGLYVKATP